MAIGAYKVMIAAAPGSALMVDICPPATSRDRWMYEQGRLAEGDPRSHAAPDQPAPAESDREVFRNAAIPYLPLKYHPAQPNEWTEQDALLELIHMKFQSGNDVPVERITLTRDELDFVFPGLLK